MTTYVCEHCGTSFGAPQGEGRDAAWEAFDDMADLHDAAYCIKEESE